MGEQSDHAGGHRTLICFDIGRDQIDVLSLGCGDDPYVVSKAQIDRGGKLAWSDVIFAAMRLQSLAAINQARLLLGPPSIIRIALLLTRSYAASP
jgi:uncharacterized protein